MSELNELVEEAGVGADIGDEYTDIDLSEAADFAVFEEDDVTVEVIAAEKKISKAKNPYIKVRLRLIDGEHANRQLFENINLTGAGAGMGRVTLEALDADIDWDKPRVAAGQLIGLTAQINVRIERQTGYADKLVAKNWRAVSAAAGENGTLK